MRSFSRHLLIYLAALATLAQIALAELVDGRVYGPLRYLAPVVGILSLVLIFWPMFTLREYGQVEAGRGYMATNRVVDRGLYGVVRHPQYLGYMGINVTFMLVAQHALTLALGLLAIALFYAYSLREEKLLAAAFGDVYLAYARRVPRFNIIAGLIAGARRGRSA